MAQVTLTLFVLCLIVLTNQSEDCGVFKDVNHVPWNVGLYIENSVNNLELICIGTAIKPGFVVTAAHCFCDTLTGKIKSNNFFITYGDLKKTLSQSGGSNLQKVRQKNIKLRLWSENIFNLDILTEDIDSGAGLMFLNIADNLWYIRGVVSVHDVENKNLVFYSNINIYLNWLSGISAKP
ncbi:hypothetical protein NQ314_011859 [Rhamnusium bicolor]|uniref:Peptidase S1 domain-containing protein n=1 Tax=Rhamnusium bicolor TaxID=1586634 RepID=A0AAV8XGA1_9CUCU|nr:hypothetical protein NQ314_011859 [Rhamnusium bicolor]